MTVNKKDMEYRDFLKSKYVEVREKYGKEAAEDIAELIIKFDDIVLGLVYENQEQIENLLYSFCEKKS